MTTPHMFGSTPDAFMHMHGGSHWEQRARSAAQFMSSPHWQRGQAHPAGFHGRGHFVPAPMQTPMAPSWGPRVPGFPGRPAGFDVRTPSFGADARQSSPRQSTS
ncbi:hypothetical protein B0H19DRAFT_1160550 [Mycena capillaripes]|nr:hypothetical protein B0H19DRAFT_1160550 [Mycena capillaripes]